MMCAPGRGLWTFGEFSGMGCILPADGIHLRYHRCRCRTTPASYIRFLQERKYEYVVAVRVGVDFRVAFSAAAKWYGIRRIATDTGGRSTAFFLDTGLVDSPRCGTGGIARDGTLLYGYRNGLGLTDDRGGNRFHQGIGNVAGKIETLQN